jgi:uncharacterized protein (DUF305 family)
MEVSRRRPRVARLGHATPRGQAAEANTDVLSDTEVLRWSPMKRAMSRAAEVVKPASPDAAAEVGDPSAANAMWAAMMVPHHRTGIQMAEPAASEATTASVRQQAAKSKADQEVDLPRLERTLSAAGKTAMPPEKQIEQMNRQHTQTLQSMSSTDFDRHWITLISGHHMSAIMMTDTAMAGSSNDGAKQLEKELRSTQLEELGELNSLWGQLT